MTVRILTGHCLDRLRELPAASVHAVVTSPPYWGLRDYGLPPSVWGGDAACAHLWGDELRIHKGGPHGDGVLLDGGRGVVAAQAAVKDRSGGRFCQHCGAWKGCLGLEPTPWLFVEHMVEVFRAVWRVLRDDGTLWLNLGDSYAGDGGYTPNAPSNVARRARGNHEDGRFGFRVRDHEAKRGTRSRPPSGSLKPKDIVGIPWRVAFALQDDGWYLRSDVIWHKPNPMPESVTDRPTKAHEYLFLLAKRERYYFDHEAIKEVAATAGEAVFDPGTNGLGGGDRRTGSTTRRFSASRPAMRNKRSVWTVASQPFKGAHFATFPPALIEPCIVAGAPVGGVVLDPFGGAGTTGLVADRLGREALLVELNPEYAAMAEARIHNDSPLLVRVEVVGG